MLAIHPSKPQKCIPNLLPARINHNGPINDMQQYWNPETDDKGTQHVHFRGRHLHGTCTPLPSTHTGAVLNITEKLLPQTQPHPSNQDDDDEMEVEQVETKIAEQIGEFDDLVVWEHGSTVDSDRDGFVRGMREWVGWAESMHVDEEGREAEGKKV